MHPRTLAVTLLLSQAVLFAATAHAAPRGGWDGNGTSVSGLASAPQPEEAGFFRKGGWDANGSRTSGLAQGGSAKVRTVQVPATKAP